MTKTCRLVKVFFLAQTVLLISILAPSIHAGTIFDVDGDGKEGIAESIQSLQIAAGLPPGPVAESIHSLQIAAGLFPAPVGTYINSIGMHFRLIPAGTFVMGSPLSEPNREPIETQHTVTLTEPYYQQTTEVTQGQWQTIVGSNPSYDTGCGSDCPVEQVSYFDAHYFANALSLADTPSKMPCYDLTECSGVVGTNYTCTSVTINQDCNGYSLPSEAQWEYAARAGTTTALYSGHYDGTYNNSCGAEPNLTAIGWFCGNSGNEIHPVAQLMSNDWGMYDTSGNVYEWCEDSWQDYPDDAVVDPLVTGTSTLRMIRGGSYSVVSSAQRSAWRHIVGTYTRHKAVGFRLVLHDVN